MRPENVPIEVDFAPAGVSPYAAVVKLCGEHDVATRDELTGALAPLYGDLLLDLSECEFIDSSVIALVLRKSQELTRDGHRIELVVEAGSNVERALQIVDIRQFLTIHDQRPLDGSVSSDRAAGGSERPGD
jgi:anti-anti-sigma factor